MFSYPYSGPSVDYMGAWLDGVREEEVAAPGCEVFLDLVDQLGWTQSQL